MTWPTTTRTAVPPKTGGYGHVMAPLLVLVASPLLGPAVWRPLEHSLRREMWLTSVVAVRGPVRTGDEALAQMLAALPGGQEIVVVAHSNAGAYVPALVTGRQVAAAVFIDAVLPPAAGGPVRLAPPALLDFLRDKADADRLLPPWTTWWDEDDVASLFPDAQTRALVESEQPRLPLSYFEGSLAAPPGWDNRPMAYLAFGDTYAAERADAAQRGWPTTTLSATHLHMLHDPDPVALELTTLLRRLDIDVSPSG